MVFVVTVVLALKFVSISQWDAANVPDCCTGLSPPGPTERPPEKFPFWNRTTCCVVPSQPVPLTTDAMKFAVSAQPASLQCRPSWTHHRPLFMVGQSESRSSSPRYAVE